MPDHSDWVASGFCPAIFTEEDETEHWCRLPAEDDGLHHDADGTEMHHVAPWRYAFPKQETMVRWKGLDDAQTDVEWLVWKPDPVSAQTVVAPDL
jgi:hypothetical protein